MMPRRKPHIVIIIPRGEVIRNFLYSETLEILAKKSRVTLLSVVHDSQFYSMFGDRAELIVPLEDVSKNERWIIRYLRTSLQMAYWRSVWSNAHASRWEEHNYRASLRFHSQVKRNLNTILWSLLANRRGLALLSRVERALSYWLRPSDDFINLFEEIKPDLVFCGSHIHGEGAYHPVQAANHLGIPAATFIFSWDNLTTQGRIIPKYQHFMVWNSKMKTQLLEIYPDVTDEQITVTGTPQFDFYNRSEFFWTKREFCERMGLVPDRPIILYTTAFPSVFPAEAGHLEAIIHILEEYPVATRPQLLVRVYAKDDQGTFDKHIEKYRNSKDVIFPATKWNPEWYTPQYQDLFDLTNMIRHADMGINGASTISLELCMFDKPVINLGFDPPGSNLPFVQRWSRHIEFDHYRPVVEAEAVMVARTVDDVRDMIRRGLSYPSEAHAARSAIIDYMFEGLLDGRAGERVAECLLALAGDRPINSAASVQVLR